MNLLHIDSSIQGEGSASRAISAAVVARLAEADPQITVEYRDLVAEPLDHLTLASYGEPEGRETLDQFKRADIVVIGAAFYNFSVATQLKSWIDRIAVRGETFRYGPNGPEGLMGGKRVIVALSRGGLYGEGSSSRSAEHAETWLRAVLGFMGITEPEFVIAEGISMGPEARSAALGAALDEARSLTPGRSEAA